MSRIQGIDVSAIQGSIDWPLVASQGIKFAFAKASEGASYKDPKFGVNVAGAYAAGVFIGAYHFYRPKASDAEQSKMMIDLCGDLDFAPVLDVEISNGHNSDELVNSTLTILETVHEATGRQPILYTYGSFPSSFGKAFRFNGWAEYPLWLAEYSVKGPWMPRDDQNPHVPKPWATWDFWQFSGDGGERLKGINSDVDRNVFSGTLEELETLAGRRPLPSPLAY